MNERGVKQFFSDRVPLSGRLSDYALLIGQNNRVLQSIPTVGIVAATQNFPSRPNRVAIYGACRTDQVAVSDFVEFAFLNEAGAVVFHQTVWIQEFSAGPPVVDFVVTTPINFNVLGIGPIIQSRFRISQGTDVTMDIIEVLMTPLCCEYVGGMSGSDYPQRQFNPKSTEPLE